jgi:hypothetical protein
MAVKLPPIAIKKPITKYPVDEIYNTFDLKHPLLKESSAGIFRLPFKQTDLMYKEFTPIANQLTGKLTTHKGERCMEVNLVSVNHPSYLPADGPNLDAQNWTIFLDFEITGFSGASKKIISKRNGNNQYFWSLGATNTDDLTFSYYNLGTKSVTLTDGWLDYIPNNTRHRLCVTRDSNDLHRFIINGKVIYEATNTTSIGADTVDHDFNIGLDNLASGSNYIKGYFYNIIINGGYALTPDEAISLTANPYEIYKKPTIFIPQAPERKFVSTKGKPRTKQPSIGGAKIDWSNPLTRGLTLVYLPGQSLENIVGSPHRLASTGNRNIGASKLGPVWDNPDVTDEGLGYGLISGINADDPHSMAAIIMPYDNPSVGDGHIFGINNSVSFDPTITPFSMFLAEAGTTTPKVSFTQRFSSSNTSEGAVSTVDIPVAEWSTVVGVMAGDADRKLYSNYEDVVSNTNTPGGVANPLNRISLGTMWFAASNSAQEFDGKIALTAYWKDRVLTADEAASFIDNPWQIFEPKTIHAPIGELAHEFTYAKRTRTKQPPAGTKIDWSNPLTQGLKLTYLPGQSLHNHVDSTHTLQVAGDIHRGVGIQGQVWDNPDVLNEGLGANSTLVQKADEPHTFGILFLPHDQPTIGNGTLFSISNDPAGLPSDAQGSSLEIGISGVSDVLLYFVQRGDDFGGSVSCGGTIPLSYTEWNTAVAVCHNSASRKLYTDTEVVSNTSSLTGTLSVLPYINLGVFWNAPEGEFDGKIAVSCFWDRDLSAAEAQAFIENPWQIFEPQTIMAPLDTEKPELAIFDKEWTP